MLINVMSMLSDGCSVKGPFLFGSRRVDLSLADGAYVRIQCFTQDDLLTRTSL